jgi:uncharacterized protein YyaL (SSP411 family)
MSKPENIFTNQLIHETSPYLLQHAHNPVDWHAWNSKTLQKAVTENKMMLISIGYSACHWCHVMEHESFENREIAEIMNKNFICIKVDREERPDVDALYMDAIQIIHGHGGWPLNCFALPDGRPFYGGTYFRPEQWKNLLENISNLYKTSPQEIIGQAGKVTEGISESNFLPAETKDQVFDPKFIDETFAKWQHSFDVKSGGFKGAPKFPMPNNLLFLLRYIHVSKDETMRNFLELTLGKMAFGGIYDQLGGGFARYSVDAEWKVPHFEKMLYDNAQLISLYCEAFSFTKNEKYLQVAKETAGFVLRELTSVEGFFFSALDADSEGEEGKFYVWTKAEIENILETDAALFIEFYGIDQESLWEDGKNILTRNETVAAFASRKNLEVKSLKKLLDDSRQKLFAEREKRTRPGLDDKALCSWNALMIKALTGLYAATGDDFYLNSATKAAHFMIQHFIKPDGSLVRTYKNGPSAIDGFLEDYAFLAEALTELYQVTFDEFWIQEARKLTDFTILNFYDKEDGLFWFTGNRSHELVTRKKEIHDNVIPSSNSAMANVLFKLGHIFENENYSKMAERMLKKVMGNIKKYPAAFSNWGILLIYNTGMFYDVVISGPDALLRRGEFSEFYFPSKLLLGSTSKSEIPVLKDRLKPGKTMIYVCTNSECKKPAETVDETISLLSDN